MIKLGKHFSTFYVQCDDTSKTFLREKIKFMGKSCVVQSINDKELGLSLLTNDAKDCLEIEERLYNDYNKQK